MTTTTTTDKDLHPDHLWRTSKTSSCHIEDQVQCQTSEDIEMSASVAQCTQQCYNKIELSQIRVDALPSMSDDRHLYQHMQFRNVSV